MNDALLNSIVEAAFREGYDRAARESGGEPLELLSDRAAEIRAVTVPEIVARTARPLVVKEVECLRRYVHELEGRLADYTSKQRYEENILLQRRLAVASRPDTGEKWARAMADAEALRMGMLERGEY